jgi:sugar lactone lactonase YvrE
VRYFAHTLLRGFGRPDDLVFDPQGRIVFSDFYNGTISRINKDGSVTIFLHGLAGPEGLVYLPDGTLVIAEQRTNRILALSPGEFLPHLLRTLPGTPSTASCKDGVDGIALDATNNTLIIPDSPTGNVYRMSVTGRSLSLIASGISRPVGAAVDAHGIIYIADECGGALWKLTARGELTRTGNFGMLDDVVLDVHGDLLVTDLAPAIHAVIRINPTTGARTTIASRGFIEPQGLLVDSHDNVYVSDDYANVIMKYTPV